MAEKRRRGHTRDYGPHRWRGITAGFDVMNVTFIEEPELEFGSGRHIDIRFGIMDYGPLDFALGLAPRKINLGIVGTKVSIEGVRHWLEKCRGEIAAKGSSHKSNKQPTLFTRFPGFSQDCGFRSTLFIDDT